MTKLHPFRTNVLFKEQDYLNGFDIFSYLHTRNASNKYIDLMDGLNGKDKDSVHVYAVFYDQIAHTVDESITKNLTPIKTQQGYNSQLYLSDNELVGIQKSMISIGYRSMDDQILVTAVHTFYANNQSIIKNLIEGVKEDVFSNHPSIKDILIPAAIKIADEEWLTPNAPSQIFYSKVDNLVGKGFLETD